MKHVLLLLVFGLNCFVASAEQISADEMERLKKSVTIASVNDDTFEEEIDDEDIEYIELKFITRQHPDDAETYKFYVRVTIELTDKKTGTIVYSQAAREQGEVDPEYLGEDEWQFLVRQGDLERPKVTAYAVEYGVAVDKEFVVLATELDDVDTVDELTERTPKEYEQKTRILHQYFYTDANDEDDWSGWN